MFRSIILACTLAVSAMAFGPATTMSRMSTTKLSMSAEFLPGAVAPLGYFDPLGFCAGKTEGEVKVEQIDLQFQRPIDRERPVSYHPIDIKPY